MKKKTPSNNVYFGTTSLSHSQHSCAIESVHVCNGSATNLPNDVPENNEVIQKNSCAVDTVHVCNGSDSVSRYDIFAKDKKKRFL